MSHLKIKKKGKANANELWWGTLMKTFSSL